MNVFLLLEVELQCSCDSSFVTSVSALVSRLPESLCILGNEILVRQVGEPYVKVHRDL